MSSSQLSLTIAAPRKENISLGLAYSFRALVCYCPGEKHGCMQAELVLEKELKVLHLDLQVAEGHCPIRHSLST